MAWLGRVNNANAFAGLQAKSASGGALDQGFGEHFGHVLWPDIHQIADLMAATCSPRDDLCLAGLILKFLDQALTDLD